MLLIVCADAQQKRDKTNHNAYIEAVDEYMPAPGQFVNTLPIYEEGDDAAMMSQRCTKILVDNSTGDDDNHGLVTLGAYGGYITFHFDHSVANIEGQNDLRIVGNSYCRMGSTVDGSSEPAIIMVSKDVNHNWIADDPWYELSGSADVDSVGKVIYDYELTYSKAPLQNIPWTDNKGGSGSVDRNAYHPQEYYPLWVSADQLTFSGTLLPKNGFKVPIGYSQMFYRYGYVDNRPDDVTFDIGNAVDVVSRQPVSLDFIDFVRVYNATNQIYPLIGETSTEISIAEDAHSAESVKRVEAAITGISSIRTDADSLQPLYDLQGRRVQSPSGGLYIRNGKKFFIK